jgi:hypothetical protein
MITLRPVMSAFAGLVLATGLFAQTPAPKIDFPSVSPAATVKQRVGFTDIEVNYSRPGMRGRKIFGATGSLQPYGEIWRTGANNATKITFSTAVKFGGTDVPAGSYALFTIPGETEWTVILNKVPGQWGAYAYDEKNDVVRVKAKPFALPLPVETFVITFNHVEGSSALLELAWEKTLIPVKIEVDVVSVLVPQIEAAMAAPEGKKPYFPSAMFYYDNNLDLKKAAAWIDAAIAEQPDAFYMIYRKGLILEKAGDKAGALAAAQKSLEMSRKAPGLVGTEYTRLNEALIARVQ